MSTWIIGDIHGCAQELSLLLEELKLGRDDRVISVGDLFHRGPDAWGVAALMREHDVRFVLGNHELAVLKRVGLAPSRVDGSDRPPLRTQFPPMGLEDLKGDGNRSLRAPLDKLPELLIFLQGHSGFALCSRDLDGAGLTRDGRDWLVVHAGVPPRGEISQGSPSQFVYPGRVRGKRSPFWFERYPGPQLVLFGHVPNPEPFVRRSKDRIVALGLDTGCVYGGKLSAYCPQEDAFVSVPAAETYARM